MPNVTVLTNEGAKRLQTILMGLDFYGAWGIGSGTLDPASCEMFDDASDTYPKAHVIKISDDTIQRTWAITTVNAKTVTEAGLYETSLVQYLDYHATFPGIDLECGDSIGFILTDQIT